jgi:CrcB protein
MRTVLAVALAGALGALARWGFRAWFGHRFPSFPWGTMVINVSGSFILGVRRARRAEHRVADAPGRADDRAAGRLHDVLDVLARDVPAVRRRRDGLGARDIGFSVILGLLAVWLGVTAGRAVA